MNRLPKGDGHKDDANRISLAGSLLVASMDQKDPVFSRSVCIVVEHSKERSVGIVLNRPLVIDTQPLFEQLLGDTVPSNSFKSHVNFGGPLDGPVLAIHDSESLAEGGNNQGVYLSAQSDNLKQLALDTTHHCRLFIGHALWPSRKLETEIIQGKWHVLPAIPELVFSDESAMWSNGIQTIGTAIIQQTTGIKNMPLDPYMN